MSRHIAISPRRNRGSPFGASRGLRTLPRSRKASCGEAGDHSIERLAREENELLVGLIPLRVQQGKALEAGKLGSCKTASEFTFSSREDFLWGGLGSD